jgi:hypothetical protein
VSSKGLAAPRCWGSLSQPQPGSTEALGGENSRVIRIARRPKEPQNLVLTPHTTIGVRARRYATKSWDFMGPHGPRSTASDPGAAGRTESDLDD